MTQRDAFDAFDFGLFRVELTLLDIYGAARQLLILKGPMGTTFMMHVRPPGWTNGPGCGSW